MAANALSKARRLGLAPEKATPAEYIEYNGVRLLIVTGSGDHSTHDGKDCWSFTLRIPDGLDARDVARRLGETQKVIYGLRARGVEKSPPQRVVSQCSRIWSPDLSSVTWSFWTVPLDDWQLRLEEIREIAGVR